MTVEIEQGHDKEPIRGEVATVLGEADPNGADVKLKSGAEGRVRRVVPSEGGREQPR
ncbi:DUF2196 domain-containing protein [Salarchaeum japonicum]|uniref:DUF2196 domain-containing protein n=2 Tax=Salarchaeum TaxID=1075398 RepID=A0AAV3T1Q5_9EURY|nr:DUF2196 domain-containing protein [Salarchaeum japonicum]